MPSDLPTAPAGALEPVPPAKASTLGSSAQGTAELAPESLDLALPDLALPEPTSAEPASAKPARLDAPASEQELVEQAPAMAQVTSEATPEGLAEAGVAAKSSSPPRKGPLSFLSGALTSGLLAWVCLGLSARVVGYYAEHPPHYEAQFAQSIATAMKTLIVGMCFLATFSFAFIGIGLLLTFLRSLRPALRNLRSAAGSKAS